MPIHLGFNAEVAFDACNWINNDACHLLSLWRCAVLLRDGRWGFGMMPVGDGVPDAVRQSGGGDPAHEGPTNLTCSDVHAESGRMRQAFVEWRFGVPKARGRAGDAAVTRLDWPTGGVVPADCGAVEVSFGAFAAHLVETPPLAMALVAPLLHITTRIVVRAAFALVVNDLPVGK